MKISASVLLMSTHLASAFLVILSIRAFNFAIFYRSGNVPQDSGEGRTGRPAGYSSARPGTEGRTSWHGRSASWTQTRPD